MIPLIGYADRLSLRPGESIEFKVSSTGPGPFEARLWRSICADPNPAGPGIWEEAVETPLAESYPSRVQEFFPGSYVKVPVHTMDELAGNFTVALAIWPTMPKGGAQALFDLRGSAEEGITLSISRDGVLAFQLQSARGIEAISVPQPLLERCWTLISASYDAADRSLVLRQEILGQNLPPVSARRTVEWSGLQLLASSEILIAAEKTFTNGASRIARHFNGKVEAPSFYSRVLNEAEVHRVLKGDCLEGAIGHWDFSENIPTTTISDIGPNGLQGEVVNFPARAMTGWRWSGQEMCWRHQPEDYAAIHFHEDDIYDFGWDSDIALRIPDDLPS
ncbi:MAG: DUF6605 domain-containing protein, partial [Kiloniellales bacterium]|nr:DUF6605 domain-containing protein [Kiloniellales bacterium]